LASRIKGDVDVKFSVWDFAGQHVYHVSQNFMGIANMFNYCLLTIFSTTLYAATQGDTRALLFQSISVCSCMGYGSKWGAILLFLCSSQCTNKLTLVALLGKQCSYNKKAYLSQ